MNSSLKTIAVMMSTYNGEEYLRTQIDSILSQKDVDVCLYIRDDGSEDKTVEIINEYTKKNNNVIYVNKPNEKNVGASTSFLMLLKDTIVRDKKADYFAFSDQDDFWKPDKLSKAIIKLEDVATETKPALYYSNKTFVDKNLNNPVNENIVYYGDFFEGFYSSLAFGCTMVFNRKMAEISASHMPNIKSYHDAWIHRVAKCVGANIVFDRESYILYRQHGDNLVGQEGCSPTQNHWWNVFKPRKHFVQKIYKEIFENYKDYIGKRERYYIYLILSYNKKFSSLKKLACDKQAKVRGKKSHIRWVIKLLLRTL